MTESGKYKIEEDIGIDEIGDIEILENENKQKFKKIPLKATLVSLLLLIVGLTFLLLALIFT